MSWNPAVFWTAFSNAGMLSDAYFPPESTTAVKVGFERPDEVVMDGVVHTTDYAIEYQVADMELARNDVVRIDGIHYRVRQTPQMARSGFFKRAFLEKVVA